MTRTEPRISELTMELTIDAGPADVWTALTDTIGDWWPAEFYAGGSAGARRFLLEARPGGRMAEEWDDGGGVLWATVVTVEPVSRLQVVGYAFPNYGGPSQWFGTWELDAVDGATRLRFSEHAIGRVTDNYVTEKDKGWRFLWSVLKARLEGQAPPAWSD